MGKIQTHRKQHEILLVILAHAIIHPRTVMVHLPDASLAHRTVMGAFRFDAAALRALEEHLALLEAEVLDHFFGCRSLRDGALFDH